MLRATREEQQNSNGALRDYVAQRDFLRPVATFVNVLDPEGG